MASASRSLDDKKQDLPTQQYIRDPTQWTSAVFHTYVIAGFVCIRPYSYAIRSFRRLLLDLLSLACPGGGRKITALQHPWGLCRTSCHSRGRPGARYHTATCRCPSFDQSHRNRVLGVRGRTKTRLSIHNLFVVIILLDTSAAKGMSVLFSNLSAQLTVL